jgi:8-oxo-dGTP diphosphatase
LIRVAVGLVISPVGKILIAQRPNYVSQGGLWEFPGGKVEQDETVGVAIRRELWEEIGIELQTVKPEPLLCIYHQYSAETVLIAACCVTVYRGEPHSREGQALEWVSLKDITDFPFPDANEPIITHLCAIGTHRGASISYGASSILNP